MLVINLCVDEPRWKSAEWPQLHWAWNLKGNITNTSSSLLFVADISFCLYILVTYETEIKGKCHLAAYEEWSTSTFRQRSLPRSTFSKTGWWRFWLAAAKRPYSIPCHSGFSSLFHWDSCRITQKEREYLIMTFKKLFIFVFSVWVFCLCGCLCTTCMLWRQEEGVRYFRFGVTESCELLCG